MTREKLISDARKLATLEDNWDSYGGVAATQAAVDALVKFIELLPERALEHSVVGTPSYLAGIEMCSGKRNVVINFGADGFLCELYVEGEGVDWPQADGEMT